MATIEQKKTASLLNVPIWVNLLRDQGVNENIIPFCIAQLALESAYFTSTVYKLNNNPGGITWNDKYKNRPGASKGSLRPANEGGNYVKFDTLKNAAIDYIRILSRKGSLGKPIEATDINNFVDRLKANSYFGDGDATKYKTTIVSINKRLNSWVDYASIKKKSSENLITANIGLFAVLLALGYFTKKFF